MKVKNLIIGAGLSGAILAERIASELGEQVVVIEKRDHIGGNCFDYFDDNKNYIQKYGPHIFHTKIEKVWEYLSRFTDWHIFMLQVKAMIDGNLINLPFNLNSLRETFPPTLCIRLEEKLLELFPYNQNISILDLKKTEDEDLKILADYVYEKVFLKYTLKQWGTTPDELDPSVFARVPISISRDNRYFQDKYQGIPQLGYTKMIEKILDHPNISVFLGKCFPNDCREIEYERIFFTGPIDEYFEYCYGALPYRSLVFKTEKFDQESYQEVAVVSYPENYNFTRITESKKFLNIRSKETIISYEFPCAFENGKNERYYPIPSEKNEKLYNQYLKKAKEIENLYFLGRLGDYKYYNMDLVVDRVLEFFDSLTKK